MEPSLKQPWLSQPIANYQFSVRSATIATGQKLTAIGFLYYYCYLMPTGVYIGVAPREHLLQTWIDDLKIISAAFEDEKEAE